MLGQSAIDAIRSVPDPLRKRFIGGRSVPVRAGADMEALSPTDGMTLRGEEAIHIANGAAYGLAAGIRVSSLKSPCGSGSRRQDA